MSCRKQNRSAGQEREADLVINSPHYKEKTDFIIREFRQRTGLTVDIVHMGTGELLSRLEEEQSNGIWTADVFWGGGIESLEACSHLFTPYKSPQLEYAAEKYYDSGYRWTGFSVMTMVIIYNTELVPAGLAPQTWTDLLNPFFKGRIVMPDPVKSGSAYSLINAILSTGKNGENWKLLRQLKAAAGSKGIASASSDVYEDVADGVYFAGLTSEDAVLPEIASGSPLAAVYPASGTISVPDGTALIKNAPHMDTAKKFIDFVLSRDVQAIVSEQWHRRSVRADVPLPDGAEKAGSCPVLPYDISAAAQNRERILKRWQEI